MPIIFAFALLSVPAALIEYAQQAKLAGVWFEAIRFYKKWMQFGSPLYMAVELGLIIFFAYFYQSIVPSMQPKEIAEQLRKQGSTIPGVRPGSATEAYLGTILNRLTLIGAVALGLIVMVASMATSMTGMVTLQGLGSTSLMILVGVALDLVNQVKVHLMAQSYKGFLAK
jgi:preprotein translocase subunit SecY